MKRKSNTEKCGPPTSNGYAACVRKLNAKPKRKAKPKPKSSGFS